MFLKNIISGVILLTFLAFLSSCEKDPMPECNAIEEPEQWKQFVGEYLVYDSLGNFSHEMSISHIYSDSDQNLVGTDSLLIENFNGNFSFKFKFKTISGHLDFGQIDPLINYAEDQFYFWHNSDDLVSPEVENFLQNDTIHLFYLLDNTPYWLSDGVPYFNCECRETAVKQN